MLVLCWTKEDSSPTCLSSSMESGGPEPFREGKGTGLPRGVLFGDDESEEKLYVVSGVVWASLFGVIMEREL